MQKKENKEKVKSFIQDYIPISEKDWLLFNQFLKFKKIKKGDVLIKEGTQPEHLYFILKGALRTYYLKEGKERNYNFHFEDDWYAPYYSLLTNQKCKLNVVSFEDTYVAYFSFKQLQYLFNQGKNWERFGRLMAEKSFIEKEEKEEQFRLNDSEELYQIIQHEKPNFIERVPQYHLASYMGITAEALSRIRKRLSEK